MLIMTMLSMYGAAITIYETILTKAGL